MSYISKDYELPPGEEIPVMDTISVKSPDPYVPVEPLYSPGAMLVAKKKRVEKVCSVCGNTYTGLPTSLACQKDAKKASNQRYLDKQKKLKLESSMHNKLEVLPGDHLPAVIAKAITMADTNNNEICFCFNGVDVVVSPNETEAAVEKRIFDEFDKKHEEYEKSPEGIANAMRRADEILRKQAEYDGLLAACKDTFSLGSSPGKRIAWLRDITKVSDDIGVKTMPSYLMATMLLSAGYQKSDHTGLEKSAYEQPRVMELYLFGQAIDMALKGYYPHPMMQDWCEKWIEKHGIDYVY